MLSICDVCVMLYVLFVFVWCLFLSKGSEKEKVEEKKEKQKVKEIMVIFMLFHTILTPYFASLCPCFQRIYASVVAHGWMYWTWASLEIRGVIPCRPRKCLASNIRPKKIAIGPKILVRAGIFMHQGPTVLCPRLMSQY